MQKRGFLVVLFLAMAASILVCTVIGPAGIPYLGLAGDESASMILLSVRPGEPLSALSDRIEGTKKGGPVSTGGILWCFDLISERIMRFLD